MNRRHFLKHAAAASALAAPTTSFMQNLHAAQDELKKKQKSLVIFWMSGGPSHMDLWDIKADSPNGGEFKPIETSAPGVKISEVLPTVAKQMKNLAIIRSLVTGEGSHQRGTDLMNTGRTPSPIVQYPAIGATAAQQLESKELALPGFIGIGNTAQRVGPGFLGMNYAPFSVQNPGQPPANIKPPKSLGGAQKDIKERQYRRMRMFYNVEDSFSRKLYPHVGKADDRETLGSAAQQHQTIYKKAFDLTVSDLRTVFEVRTEKPEVIEKYGGMRNRFGMGALLARKLVMQGVSAVQIDLGGWDNHGNIFNTIRNGNGPRLDQGMGNLVGDLVDMGKWDDTVVMWMGEFGRTPRINQNGGRDHWPRSWSVVIGGGAIKGGVVHGKTDKNGVNVEDGRVGIGDVFASVFKGLGIDPSTKVRDNLGRPLEIATGKPIDTLFS